MLNTFGKIGFSNLTDYQQNLILDITQTIEYYAISDIRKALPIRYLKLQQSDNTDDETSVMQKLYNSTFYAYHLTPVLENQPVSPVLQDDETKQGITSYSSGEMVIQTISKPIPGDLFNFYIGNHQGLKDMSTEIFKITDVQFLRTSTGLNLYRLTYETAPIEESKLYIKKSFFWYNNFRRYYSIQYGKNMKLIEQKDILKNMLNWYHPSWSIFYDDTLSKEVNVKINKLLLFIKYNEPSNSTDIPLILINGFDPSKIQDPTIISSTEEYIGFQREDIWYTNPNYVPDPTKEWSWFDDKIPNTFAKLVWDLFELYKPFIFYKDLDRDQEDDVNIDLYHDVEINHFADYLKKENLKIIKEAGKVFKPYEENL